MRFQFSRRTFLSTLSFLSVDLVLDVLKLNALEPTISFMPKRVDTLTSSAELTIAHCCDPQLGFSGDHEYQADLARLEKEIELVNELKPDLVFFAGDMCNNHMDLKKDWPRLLKEIKVPCLFAPGNHDIPDPVCKRDVDAFCEVFGSEYSALNIKGWKIIVVNSQYCRETKETSLYEKQIMWFQNEIEDAKKNGMKVILGSHIPPFVKAPDEKDEYFNFPMKIRQNYLDFVLENGAQFYLAGHTHTTLEREYLGMPILNGETTSKNFDKRPHGFRLLKIDAQMNYEWNFVRAE